MQFLSVDPDRQGRDGRYRLSLDRVRGRKCWLVRWNRGQGPPHRLPDDGRGVYGVGVWRRSVDQRVSLQVLVARRIKVQIVQRALHILSSHHLLAGLHRRQENIWAASARLQARELGGRTAGLAFAAGHALDVEHQRLMPLVGGIARVAGRVRSKDCQSRQRLCLDGRCHAPVTAGSRQDVNKRNSAGRRGGRNHRACGQRRGGGWCLNGTDGG